MDGWKEGKAGLRIAYSNQKYRPITNLCAMTKVYKQLIINRIKEIKQINLGEWKGGRMDGWKGGW